MSDRDLFLLGRSFLGAATLGSGVLQLVIGEFVRLVPKLPPWVPAPAAWACLVGAVLIVLGLAILLARMETKAASLLGAFLLFDLVFFYLPQLLSSPAMDRPYLRGFMWTNPLK